MDLARTLHDGFRHAISHHDFAFSVQLIAQHRDELSLLRAATIFQSVTGWDRRHPID
jgi:hypothetical protein